MPVMQGSGGNGPVTIGPNDQAVFEMGWDPYPVTVENVSLFNGVFVSVWVYASTTSVTPMSMDVLAEAQFTLRPPAPDPNGNPPATLLIYNVSGCQLTATPN